MPTSAVYPLLRPDLRHAIDRGHAALGSVMRPSQRVISAGTVIIREEEAHDFVYLLHSGWVARSRQLCDGERQIIVTFLPNDIFGVKSIFLEKQPDSVVALSDATVSSVDRRTARDLAARDPDVALYLMFQLGEDERRLHNWVTALGRPALERIAFMLLELRGRLDRLGLLNGDGFRLPMTQQDMGDSAGLSFVHVNRTLREMRERGILRIDRGVVHIEDLAKLRDLALPVLDVFERQAKGFGATAQH